MFLTTFSFDTYVSSWAVVFELVRGHEAIARRYGRAARACL